MSLRWEDPSSYFFTTDTLNGNQVYGPTLMFGKFLQTL